MTEQIKVTREAVGHFSTLLSGYIEKNLLAEWGDDGRMSDEEVTHMHNFICKRLGMYLPLIVEPLE